MRRPNRSELGAEGEVGQAVAHRMAVMFVRMDRCVDQETAALSGRVRAALDGFEVPDGVAPVEAERLRAEAGRRAMFDPSREATLARKYEPAAERCFFRSLKELRQLKKQPAGPAAAEVAADVRRSMAQLGSFLPEASPARSATPAPTPTPLPTPLKVLLTPSKALPTAWDPTPAHFDVPFAIGRPR